jgi:hypothetical protein
MIASAIPARVHPHPQGALMAISTPILPSTSTSTRIAQIVQTIRWAPAPQWGSSTADHGRYVTYLAGSMLAWTVLGVLLAAGIGELVSL